MRAPTAPWEDDGDGDGEEEEGGFDEEDSTDDDSGSSSDGEGEGEDEDEGKDESDEGGRTKFEFDDGALEDEIDEARSAVEPLVIELEGMGQRVTALAGLKPGLYGQLDVVGGMDTAWTTAGVGKGRGGGGPDVRNLQLLYTRYRRAEVRCSGGVLTGESDEDEGGDSESDGEDAWGSGDGTLYSYRLNLRKPNGSNGGGEARLCEDVCSFAISLDRRSMLIVCKDDGEVSVRVHETGTKAPSSDDSDSDGDTDSPGRASGIIDVAGRTR
jgi:hypothetical protein